MTCVERTFNSARLVLSRIERVIIVSSATRTVTHAEGSQHPSPL